MSELGRIYRESLKPADSLFNIWLARPLAAPLVMILAKTRVTPNQVTMVSIVVMLASVAAFIGLPGALGLWLGVALVEASYILDCCDGQLARVTGRTSEVGGLLDFLMDELKAFLLVGALAVRWSWHEGGGSAALLWGIAILIVVGSALSLTKFLRTPEYAAATGTEVQKHGTSAGQRNGALWPVMVAVRAISQYPATLPIFAVLGAMDVFLYAYGAVHLLYVGRTVLVIVLRLGRFAPREGSS